SVEPRLMVLAGPVANLAAGAVCWAILRGAPPRSAAVRLFLWVSVAFQWLVAAGYLAVGAASGFGDWPVILPALSAWPARLARAPGRHRARRRRLSAHVACAGATRCPAPRRLTPRGAPTREGRAAPGARGRRRRHRGRARGWPPSATRVGARGRLYRRRGLVLARGSPVPPGGNGAGRRSHHPPEPPM